MKRRRERDLVGAVNIQLSEGEIELLKKRAEQAEATIEELSGYLFRVAVTIFLASPTIFQGLDEIVGRLAYYDAKLNEKEAAPDAAQPASNRTGPLAD